MCMQWLWIFPFSNAVSITNIIFLTEGSPLLQVFVLLKRVAKVVLSLKVRFQDSYHLWQLGVAFQAGETA